jgi:hypothetical protein
VRYNDPKATWLYLDPHHGTMLKQERQPLESVAVQGIP